MSVRSTTRAYTLIELLLVVALLGLAGTLVIPQMTGRDSMRVQAAVRKMIGDLSFAQSDALAHQEYRRVHFFDDGSGYCIVRVNESNYANAWDGDTADYLVDPISSVGGAGGLYITRFTDDDRWGGVEILDIDIDGGGSDIVYDALGGTIRGGGLPGLGGTIEIGAGEDVFIVTVSPFTGKLSVERDED